MMLPKFVSHILIILVNANKYLQGMRNFNQHLKIQNTLF